MIDYVNGWPRVGAVIVTYHPDAEFASRVEVLHRQVDRIVVIDNGSAAEAVNRLRSVASNLGITLVLNAQNLGVAAALNQGADLLMAEGFQWAITQDQDSTPASDMVRRLRATAARYDPQMLAIVAPNIIDQGLPDGIGVG